MRLRVNILLLFGQITWALRCPLSLRSCRAMAPCLACQEAFSVDMATLLAGFSFEAYNEPRVGKVSKGQDGTQVTFTSTSFIRKAFKGVFIGSLRSAVLQNSQLQPQTLPERIISGDKPDVYVSIDVKDKPKVDGDMPSRVIDSFISSVKDNKLDPVWNETFTLYITSSSASYLAITVWDKELFQDNKAIAFAAVDWATSAKGSRSVPLYLTNPEEKNIFTDWLASSLSLPWLPKSNGLKKIGELVLDFEYVPFQQDVSEGGNVSSSRGSSSTALPQGSVNWPLLLDGAIKSGFSATKSDIVSASLFDSLHKKDLHEICFIENESTDTQVGVWVDDVHKQIVLAFRGTEQIKFRDILTDINLALTPFSTGLSSGVSLTEAAIKFPSSSSEEYRGLYESAKCHSGFLGAYRSVQGALLQILRIVLNQSEAEWNIHVTGHSLGGALASLLAFDLGRIRAGLWDADACRAAAKLDRPAATDRVLAVNDANSIENIKKIVREKEMESAAISRKSIPYSDPVLSYLQDEIYLDRLRKANVITYTFGAPRVGDSAFMALSNALMPHHFRIVNNRDIVSRIPRSSKANRLLEYEHVGKTVLIRDECDSDEVEAEIVWIEGESDGVCPLSDISPFRDTAVAAPSTADTSADGPNVGPGFLGQLSQFSSSARGQLQLLQRAVESYSSTANAVSDVASSSSPNSSVSAAAQMLGYLSDLEAALGFGEAGLAQISAVYQSAVDVMGGFDARFVEREMQLLSAIIDGRAIEQHLEPAYFMALKRACDAIKKNDALAS